MLSLLRRPAPAIRFACQPEDFGVIAEPKPAKASLPDWFRKLPAVDKSHLAVANNGLTVKRCMPFFDAMATGWILPLAATVRLEIKDDGGWEYSPSSEMRPNASRGVEQGGGGGGIRRVGEVSEANILHTRE